MPSANNYLYETSFGFQRERRGVDPTPPPEAWLRRWPINEAEANLFDEGGRVELIDGEPVIHPAKEDPMTGSWAQGPQEAAPPTPPTLSEFIQQGGVL